MKFNVILASTCPVIVLHSAYRNHVLLVETSGVPWLCTDALYIFFCGVKLVLTLNDNDNIKKKNKIAKVCSKLILLYELSKLTKLTNKKKVVLVFARTT